jgi:XTP/dITP diphosphohydrolase
MLKLLIASTNHGKLDEFRDLLTGRVPVLTTPQELDLELTVEEKGDSYGDNATYKAEAYAKASGLLTLADDSGLEVEALGGVPGIRSARFALKPGATDADRRVYLLSQLEGKNRPWKARFVCTVAVCKPGSGVQLFRGECSGEIITEERGRHGFGYDPIFFIPGMEKTMAELSMEEKNQISHRARAVQATLPFLLNLLSLPA